MNVILIFFTFSVLTIIALLNEDLRLSALGRTSDEWTADIIGLLIQGIIIPAFPFLIVPLLAFVFPTYDGYFELNALFQFILSFFVVDYLYYWNHRFFHGRKFWTIHRLHHSSRHLDVFATSRNSFITSFLFVYVWVQIIAMYFLKDPTVFMLGLGFTFALDLWRHSGIKSPDILSSALGWALILPEQHTLHHSLQGRARNFGANLCWWDKIHGTFSEDEVMNKNLEKISSKNIWKELFVPWSAK